MAYIVAVWVVSALTSLWQCVPGLSRQRLRFIATIVLASPGLHDVIELHVPPSIAVLCSRFIAIMILIYAWVLWAWKINHARAHCVYPGVYPGVFLGVYPGEAGVYPGVYHCEAGVYPTAYPYPGPCQNVSRSFYDDVLETNKQDRKLLWKLVPIQVVFLWYLTHHALEFSENLQVYAYPKVEGDVVIWASNSYANGTKIIFEDSQWRFSIEALLLACDNPFTQIWKPTCLLDNTCITWQGHWRYWPTTGQPRVTPIQLVRGCIQI